MDLNPTHLRLPGGGCCAAPGGSHTHPTTHIIPLPPNTPQTAPTCVSQVPAVAQHQMAVQAQVACSHCRSPRVVRLDAPNRHHAVVPFFQRLCQQKLQLANLQGVVLKIREGGEQWPSAGWVGVGKVSRPPSAGTCPTYRRQQGQEAGQQCPPCHHPPTHPPTTPYLVARQLHASQVIPLDVQLAAGGHPWHRPRVDGRRQQRQPHALRRQLQHSTSHTNREGGVGSALDGCSTAHHQQWG